MLVDINSFLHSLAIYMVYAASQQTPAVTINYSGAPRGLWIHKMAEPDPNDTNTPPPAAISSVLKIYGGPSNSNDEQRRASIQCMTTTLNEDEIGANTQAQVLYETLLDPSAPGEVLRPLRNLVIPNYVYPGVITDGNWKIVSISIRQQPGKVGIDPIKFRPLIAFNFDAGFVPVD